MFCQKCGNQIDDNSKFCKYCGAYADGENTVIEQTCGNYAGNPEYDAMDNMQSQVHFESPSFDPVVTEDIEYPGFIQTDSDNQNFSYGKKHGISKSATVVISILSTLLVVTVGFLCWTFFVKDDDKPVDEVSDESLYFEQGDSYNVGDYITFGSYEQDGDTSNGKEDIEWQVLDIQDGKAFVVSKYALDAKHYNDEYTDVTWEDCTLRQWLNDDFLNSAFTYDEQNAISKTSLTNPDNDSYGTDGGNKTSDKIFLLSIDEANKYFDSDYDRECEPTQYAIDMGAYENSDNGNCRWWLRSPGDYQVNAALVDTDGSVRDYGHGVYNYSDAVRPALWLNLES